MDSNNRNNSHPKKPSLPLPRHGLRLIVSKPTEQEEPCTTPPKVRKPNAFVSQLKHLADSLDAEVAMILKM